MVEGHTARVRVRGVQVSLSNDSITLVASNAASAETRLALKQLHVQLMDIHGNFTSPGCRSDCRVRVHTVNYVHAF